MRRLLLLIPLTACKTFTPLPEASIDRLSSCAINLDTSRRNLLARGYAIEHAGADYFSTDYKRSSFEDVKSLFTQDIREEVRRKFVVFANGPQAIKFRFRYQTVERGSGLVSLSDPQFVYEQASLYELVREEICERVGAREGAF